MKRNWSFLVPGALAVMLMPAASNANTGDFTGGVAIGSSYAGVNTAPTNGLIVQGNVGIGNTSPSDTLDLGAAGTATGVVRLEGATSGYVRIAPPAAAGSWTLTLPNSGGSNGNLLSTDGTGVTSWVSSSSVSGAPLVPGGRLSLSSLAAVTTADVTAATTIYYLPYQGELVPIYNGSAWQELDVGGSGKSLSLDPTKEVSNSVYDVYVLNNSGAPVLCAMNWGGTSLRSTTSGGTGGAADASVTQLNGIWVNNAAIASGNCYNGTTSYSVSQNQGTLLGSFYTPTSVSSSLTNTITSGTTSISLTTTPISGAGLIGVNYYEALDTTTSTEYVLVTGGWNTTTQTVTRGQLGTSAISHNSGKTVAVAGGQTAMQFFPTQSSNGTGNLMGLSNVYNTVRQGSTDSDSNWLTTYSTAAYQIINNSVLNKIYFVQSVAQYPFSAYMNAFFANTSSANYCYAGPGNVNSSTSRRVQTGMSGSNATPMMVQTDYTAVFGLNYVAPLEYANGGTCTLGPGNGVNAYFSLSGQF
jgi:hypothetical protein